MPITLSMSLGVITSTPVLLTCRKVLYVHTPPDAASVTIHFVAGVISVCGANTNATIPEFVGRSKKGVVW